MNELLNALLNFSVDNMKRKAKLSIYDFSTAKELPVLCQNERVVSACDYLLDFLLLGDLFAGKTYRLRFLILRDVTMAKLALLIVSKCK